MSLHISMKLGAADWLVMGTQVLTHDLNAHTSALLDVLCVCAAFANDGGSDHLRQHQELAGDIGLGFHGKGRILSTQQVSDHAHTRQHLCHRNMHQHVHHSVAAQMYGCITYPLYRYYICLDGGVDVYV